MVLIQNHLVFHNSIGEHVTGNVLTFYEANWLQAYNLIVRDPKLQDFAAAEFRDKDSDRAREVILRLIELGHTTIGNLQQLCLANVAYRPHSLDDEKDKSTHESRGVSGDKVPQENGRRRDRNSDDRDLGQVANNHSAEEDEQAADANEEEDPVENGKVENIGGKKRARSVPKSTAIDTPFSTTEEVQDMVQKLLRRGFVVPVNNDVDFKTEEDLHLDVVEDLAERNVKEDTVDGKTKAARLLCFQSKIRELKNYWREPTDAYHESKSSSHRKRRHSSDTPPPAMPRKKQKVNGEHVFDVDGSPNGAIEEALTFSDDMIAVHEDLVVRPNFEKLTVIMRNRWLVRQASHYIGEPTSKVFSALVAVLEKRTIRCYGPPANGLTPQEVEGEDEAADEVDMSVTVPELLEMLTENDNNLEPKQDLLNAVHANGANGHDVEPPTNGQNADGIIDLDDGDDENDIKNESDDMPNGTDNGYDIGMAKTAQRKNIIQHLHILKEDPHRFVDSSDGRNWHVPFKILIQQLIQCEIEQSVKMRYGTIASQVVRILRRVGKLEEKQIANLALFRPKDLRVCIAAMLKDRIIECQEIPKDKNFTLLKSSWLYGYEVHNARQQLLSVAYKAQCCLLQRIQQEYEAQRLLMEKAERTDVRYQLKKYLSAREQESFTKLVAREDAMMREISRIDDFVAVLRDFSSMDWQIDNARGEGQNDTYHQGAVRAANGEYKSDVDDIADDQIEPETTNDEDDEAD